MKGGGTMYTAKVLLEDVVGAKEFVSLCNEMDFKVELISGPYIIDAKSIMGIFSLDLSEPIELQAHCRDEAAFLRFKDRIEKFLIKE